MNAEPFDWELPSQSLGIMQGKCGMRNGERRPLTLYGEMLNAE